MAETLKTPSQKREEWDKYGKYKYIIQRINTMHTDLKGDLKDIKTTLRYIIMGLEHEFLFDKAYLEDVICKESLDRDIIEELHGAGTGGLLPQDLADRIDMPGTKRSKPWKVTIRIRRMNRTLNKLIGQNAFEKQGMNFVLTSFMRKAWGMTREELHAELAFKPESENEGEEVTTSMSGLDSS